MLAWPKREQFTTVLGLPLLSFYCLLFSWFLKIFACVSRFIESTQIPRKLNTQNSLIPSALLKMAQRWGQKNLLEFVSVCPVFCCVPSTIKIVSLRNCFGAKGFHKESRNIPECIPVPNIANIANIHLRIWPEQNAVRDGVGILAEFGNRWMGSVA